MSMICVGNEPALTICMSLQAFVECSRSSASCVLSVLSRRPVGVSRAANYIQEKRRVRDFMFAP
jgi:BarA-like signal transduction histidine kinase